MAYCMWGSDIFKGSRQVKKSDLTDRKLHRNTIQEDTIKHYV